MTNPAFEFESEPRKRRRRADDDDQADYFALLVQQKEWVIDQAKEWLRFANAGQACDLLRLISETADQHAMLLGVFDVESDDDDD